jgi:hypothetical protein
MQLCKKKRPLHTFLCPILNFFVTSHSDLLQTLHEERPQFWVLTYLLKVNEDVSEFVSQWPVGVLNRHGNFIPANHLWGCLSLTNHELVRCRSPTY